MRPGQAIPFAVNWLWLHSSRAEYRHFVDSLESPRKAQAQCLAQLLQKNAGTHYGQAYKFSRISSVAGFQKQVPLTQYEDYLPHIAEIAQGKSGVLTCDPVILFQPTSGGSSASKLIPYTRSLKAEYQRAIAAWIHGLYSSMPDLMKGQAYWSVSPSVWTEERHGCIPVGFDSDAEYLGLITRQLYGLVSVKPGSFAPNISMDDFWTQTLVNLLSARSLTLISVWSPTFLLALVKHFTSHRDEIIRIMAIDRSRATRARVVEIQRITQSDRIAFESIWPDLKLISCWVHGASQVYVPEIRKHFPRVRIEGKGLIATEAFVSLPLISDKDPVLAVNSHFFEFQDAKTGEIHLADGLREGNIYSVIVTTGGGLYRYQLNDLVRVTGYIGATPTLRFVSKKMVSDLCGEKLNAEHVQRSVEWASARCSLSPTFLLLAPVKSNAQSTAYVLFVQSQEATHSQLKTLGESLEELLLENFHYAYCRRIGQLNSLRVFLVDASGEPPETIYLKEMSRRGQRLGDVKPVVLDREFGWEQRLAGRFLDADSL